MKATKLIIKLVLLVIIPLLVATGICVYSTKRYVSLFPEYYVTTLDESRNTEEKIERYIKYYSNYYEELTEIEDALQDNGYVLNEKGEKLFSIKAYRWFFVDEDDSSNNKYNYVFVLYNVHYGNLYYTIYEKGHSPIPFNGYVPYFNLHIEDNNDEDLEYDLKFYANSDYTMEDYNYEGYNGTKRYENGDPINSDVTTRWAQVDSLGNDFGTDVKITIQAIDQYQSDIAGTDEEALEAATLNACEYNYANFTFSTKHFDAENGTLNGVKLTAGFAEDYKEAGYNKYVWAKWCWWEAIVAIVLTLIITGSTVLVWDAEDKKEKTNLSKIKK